MKYFSTTEVKTYIAKPIPNLIFGAILAVLNKIYKWG